MFCAEKEKRRQERESHGQALNVFKERRKQQLKKPDEAEKEAVYSQIAQNMEKTRNVFRRSISRASTICAEEKQLTLTEKEFDMIRQKMVKIDHHLNEMYKNWHVEYGNANTLEECEEIKNFYEPYLDKYESKYQILYQLLRQPSLLAAHDGASGITPSLAALDDATSLKQAERVRNELGKDIPQQYSTIEGQLTLHTPLNEDMRLEPTLNVTPEGLLTDIPTVMERDIIGTSSETAYILSLYTSKE